MDRFFELIKETPFWDQVHEQYDEGKEHVQEANYQLELQIRRLKRSV